MPMDRGVVDQQLQALGEGSRWWDVRELRDLPAVLHDDERILAIARGRIGRVRWLRRAWLILVTDQRLICLRSGTRSTWRQLEVPAGQIGRVSLRIGPARGRVIVAAGGSKYRLLVPRKDAHKLLSALSLLSTTAALPGAGPGPTRMVRRVVEHILALPAVALDPGTQAPPRPAAPDTTALEERMETMEAQLERLEQHVDFLESLLRRRHDVADLSNPRRLESQGSAASDA